MSDQYPTIEPGLRVRYREDLSTLSLRGETRVVEAVDENGLILGLDPADRKAITITLARNSTRFWQAFEPIEQDTDTADDTDGGPEQAPGVWVVWFYSGDLEPLVASIHANELPALRIAVAEGHKASYVEYGTDVQTVLS